MLLHRGTGGRKKKFSTKGVSKKQNEITWQRFKSPLDGSKDMATNIGLRMNNGRMVTYEQQKLAERLLRQTLGIGRRHSHRADRVSQLDCWQ